MKTNLLSELINEYSHSWYLLQAFDEQSLKANESKQNGMVSISFEDAIAGINQLKAYLIDKGQASELFGQLRGDGLASALGSIEQGFGGEYLYPNVATRAAHLLYFIIKNHPLADGNKRSAAFLFIWYLNLNKNFLARPVKDIINDNALATIALLVARSKPEDKELMINLVQNLILSK